ncbi:MAG: GHKL domain-containing protein [Bacilli bacterium]|nr:GHKL domain-containing protein [Bacilli bacterium]
MNIINVILSDIITSVSIIFSIRNITKIKIELKSILLFILIMLPLGVITCTFFDGVTKLIFNIIIMIIALYFSIFNRTLSKSVFYALVYEILAFIAEMVISVIFVSILKFDLGNYENFSFSLFVFSICNCLMVYLLSKIPIINKSIKKFEKLTIKKYADWFYLIIIVILMILLLTFNRYNLNNNLSFYINVGMVAFILITLIYFIYNNIQKYKLEDKYNQMMDYVSKYEKIINDQGKKNHEYNNQLMVIKGYMNNPVKLREYLDLIIDEHKTGQNYTIKQLGYLPDGGIKGLIYHKLSKMEENNIKPYLYIDQSVKDIFEIKFDINTYRDITKLLGVFIDNAIDASKDANPKEIELDIKNKDGCLLITISNTFDNSVDIDQIGKKGFTTKGVGHGFGLSIVRDISKNNDNIETVSDISNNKFIQTIIIYYKN